ncbi:helix-turn-helix domain-containing protein [Paenibacillus macerans]|nr:helix-turn-helix domain-containing protein [Paenibacillus macerans]
MNSHAENAQLEPLAALITPDFLVAMAERMRQLETAATQAAPQPEPAKNEPTETLRPVMTVTEVAHHLRRSVRTIYRRIHSGELRSYKEGHDHRIRREWVLEYEERNAITGRG